jgi:hypothetical protein
MPKKNVVMEDLCLTKREEKREQQRGEEMKREKCESTEMRGAVQYLAW